MGKENGLKKKENGLKKYVKNDILMNLTGLGMGRNGSVGPPHLYYIFTLTLTGCQNYGTERKIFVLDFSYG